MTELPRLNVSENGHYIETEYGDPFMWISETLWYFVQRTTRDDVRYILDRLSGITNQSLGGTTVIKATIAMKLQPHDPTNPVNEYGFEAFNGGAVPNFSSPKVVAGGSPDNPKDYWDHLDFIVRETKNRGLYLTLVPQWSNSYVDGSDCDITINASTARAYGQWLGNRYKNETHIIWMLGGDGKDPEVRVTQDIYRAQAEGILKGITGCIDCPNYNETSPLWDKVLMTYHGNVYDSSSSDFWNLNVEKWCNIDGVYGGRFKSISNLYNLSNPRPIIETEGYGFWSMTETQIRRARAHQYHHYLSGGCGPEHMNEYIWNFTGNWKSRLNVPERVQFTIMKSIFESVAWYELIPDQNIILSSNSYPDDDFLNTIIASRSLSNDLIMVYFSSFSPKTAQIDLSSIVAGNVKGTWINPINGSIQETVVYSTSDDPWVTIPTGWTDGILKLEVVDIECTDVCIGYDLWSQNRVGEYCVTDQLLESNSPVCGFNPCEGVVCGNICVGDDLWSQHCNPDNGQCEPDQLISQNSIICKIPEDIPTDESTINTYLILGGIGALALAILMFGKKS